ECVDAGVRTDVEDEHPTPECTRERVQHGRLGPRVEMREGVAERETLTGNRHPTGLPRPPPANDRACSQRRSAHSVSATLSRSASVSRVWNGSASARSKACSAPGKKPWSR